MKPICVPCSRFFRPKENGIPFIECMPVDNMTPPGNREPENWRDYKLWMGDLWECPDCKATVIVGAGLAPVSEHYQDNYKAMKEHYAPTIRVNDC